MQAGVAEWARVGSIASMCAAALAAQRTWIVDHAARSGSHFTDLPPAVAAASSGDTVIVRQASGGFVYSAAVVVSGLTIVREPVDSTGTVDIQGLTIRDVPVGQMVTISGLRLGGVWIERVPSLVTIESCDSGPVQVTDCAHVAVHMTWLRSALAYPPPPAVDVKRSYVRFDQAWTVEFGTLLQWSGILAEDSVLVATRSHFAGTPATMSVWCQPVSPGSPAMVLTRSQVFLGHGCSVSGGQAWCYMIGRVCPGASVAGVGSVLAKDGTVDLGCGTSTTIDPATPYFVSAGAAAAEGVVDLRVDGPAGWFAFLAASFAPATRIPTPFGTLGLDPREYVVLAIGQLGPSGTLTVAMPVEPGLPPTTVFAMQAVLLSSAGQPVLTFPGYAGILP
jgi:hypothetical protein